MIDISKLSPRQLSELHAKVEDRLRKLEIIRTANNPTGDYAEFLFLTAFPRWKPAAKSQKGSDAVGPAPKKLRYQIKARRIIRDNANSRQLSAIRGLKEPNHFNFLAGLLFNKDHSVYKAALIPHAVVLRLEDKKTHISYQERTHSHLFQFVDAIWEVDGVKDVTKRLLKAENLIDQRHRSKIA